MTQKHYIFIASSNEFDRKILKNILQTYDLNFFSQLSDIQEAVAQRLPSLILIDGSFGEEGFDLCKAIVTNIVTKDIPVLFILNTVNKNSITDMFQSGGSDYVLKPFNQLEIASRVHIHIRHLQHSREIQRLSSYDPMTKLYNRRTFFREAEKAIAFSIKKRQRLHLVLLQFNTLSAINELYGNFTGDKVLYKLATLIKKYFDTNNIEGRLTGNGFAVVVQEKKMELVKELVGFIVKSAQEMEVEGTRPVKIDYAISYLHSVNESVDDLLLEACQKLEECDVARTTRNY
ncbi:MAG: diguanylate cyclase [Campylobacterota bacterium]|nr:diguanylate cyclase [Campylobacterota bacterium]